MWPWKRNSNDPLAKMLFEKYQMHVLRRPRADVAVLDLYAMKDGQVMPGKLATLMDPPPPLPDVREGEPVADLGVMTSNEVDSKAGFDFLETFLNAIGAGALPLKLKGSLEVRKAAGMRFRFAGATRDYTDPFKLEFKLRKHKVPPDGCLMKAGWRYYVALGVLRTDSLGMTAVSEGGHVLDIAADAIKLATGEGKVSVKRSAGEEITIAGEQRMAFGVELSELLYNEADGRFELNVVKNVVKVMGKAAPVAYDFVDGAGGDAVLPDW
jgi:hypothetical protein